MYSSKEQYIIYTNLSYYDKFYRIIHKPKLQLQLFLLELLPLDL